MNPLFAARTRAYLRDAAGYAGLAAATLPVGLLLHHRGYGRRKGFVLAVSAIAPLVATVVASVQEAGPGSATPGKRRQRLVVISRNAEPLTLARALLRNTVKIGGPWQLGHVVAVGAAFGGFEGGDRLTWTATAVTYPLLGLLVATVARGDGRGLHDRVAGTAVRAQQAG